MCLKRRRRIIGKRKKLYIHKEFLNYCAWNEVLYVVCLLVQLKFQITVYRQTDMGIIFSICTK